MSILVDFRVTKPLFFNRKVKPKIFVAYINQVISVYDRIKDKLIWIISHFIKAYAILQRATNALNSDSKLNSTWSFE